MTRRPLAAVVLAAVWLGVIDPAAAGEVDRAAGAVTSGGSFYLTWVPDPAPIPLNELFEIRFRVWRADDRSALVPRAVVTANAWMPEHKHGTTLQPQVDSHGDGTATGRGFLLHMEGRWELRVGVALDGQMERATFELDIEP